MVKKGVSNVTVNSGQVPASVAMNLEVHPFSVLESIENADELDALDVDDLDDDGRRRGEHNDTEQTREIGRASCRERV